jgi:hypothetical protein
MKYFPRFHTNIIYVKSEGTLTQSIINQTTCVRESVCNVYNSGSSWFILSFFIKITNFDI